MLVYPKMEKLLPKAENRYTLAILVAKRARQLVDGARPLVDSDSPNLVTVACEELAADKFRGVKGIKTVYIPLRPEIEAARFAARTAADQASMAEAIRESVDAVSEDVLTLDEPDADLFQTEFLERAAEISARDDPEETADDEAAEGEPLACDLTDDAEDKDSESEDKA